MPFRGTPVTRKEMARIQSFAVHNEWLPWVKLLIERGADINARNGEGQTALTLAQKELMTLRRRTDKSDEQDYLKVLKILKSHGAKN